MKFKSLILTSMLITGSALAANGEYQTSITIEDLNIELEKAPKCALMGSRFSDILADLKAVTDSYDGKCVSRAETLINDIQGDVQLFDQYRGQLSEQAGVENVPTITAEQSQKFQSTLNSIGTMISDKQCRSEFEDSGFLPVLADTIQSVSQIALFAPSAEGLAITMGGSILSTTLKVLNQIFTPKFKWEKEEDRKAFLTFNCSYQQVKRKIESQGVYNLKDHRLDQEIKSTEARLEELNKIVFADGTVHKMLADLDAEEAHALETIKLTRETAVMSKAVGADYYTASTDLDNKLDKILKELNSIQFDENNSSTTDTTKAIAFKNAIDLKNSMDLALETIKPEESNIFDNILFQNIQERLGQLKVQNAVALMELNQEGMAKLVADIKYCKDTIQSMEQSLYQANQSAVTPNIVEQIISEISSDDDIKAEYAQKRERIISGNNQKFLDEKSYYDEVVAEKTQLDAKLADLKSQKTAVQGQDRFTVLNEGVENDATIYKLDLLNAERIYGPTGYSFLTYLVNNSENALEDFEANIDMLSERMTDADFDSLPTEQRIDYCINLREMKRIYASSVFPSEMGYDFSATNINLFHSLLKNKFTLTDERKELRDQAFSALYAKSLIDMYYAGEHDELQSVDDLLNVASEITYVAVTEKECKRKRTGKPGSAIKFSRVCSLKHKNVFFKDSIGLEMLKSTAAEARALEIQRKEAKYCAQY